MEGAGRKTLMRRPRINTVGMSTPTQELSADPLAPVPTGDRMVWLVPSDTIAGVTYRVDMLANGGNGWCSCIDFATRRQPALDKGAAGHTDATLCRHGKRVIRYFARDLFRDLARSEEGIINQ